MFSSNPLRKTQASLLGVIVRLANRGGLRPVADLQLFQDLLDVLVDGRGRDAQLACDLPVGSALTDLSQDLGLSRAQELGFTLAVLRPPPVPCHPRSAELAEQVADDDLFATSDAAQRAHEVSNRQVLWQVCRGAGSRGAEQPFLFDQRA